MLLGDPEPEENPRKGSLYTEFVQCRTVRYAMLWWLINPAAKESIWGGISKTYWKLNGQKVLRQVKAWSRKNKLLLSYDHKVLDLKNQRSGRGSNLVDRLEKALA